MCRSSPVCALWISSMGHWVLLHESDAPWFPWFVRRHSSIGRSINRPIMQVSQVLSEVIKQSAFSSFSAHHESCRVGKRRSFRQIRDHVSDAVRGAYFVADPEGKVDRATHLKVMGRWLLVKSPMRGLSTWQLTCKEL